MAWWDRTWSRTWDRTFAKWDRTRARTGTELGPNLFRSHQWVGKHWPCATILAHGVICMWDQMWDRTFFGPACAVGCRCRGNGPQTKFGPTCGGCIPGTGPNKVRSHIGGGRCSQGCLQHHRRLPQHHFEAYVLARHTCCEPCLLARYNSRRGNRPGETSPLARHISWQGIPPRDSLFWPDMPPVRYNSKIDITRAEA